jgi:hypothetical protein
MNLEQMKEARSNRIKRESQSEILQKRKEARDAIELKKIYALIMTDEDYFERMFKEVSAA